VALSAAKVHEPTPAREAIIANHNTPTQPRVGTIKSELSPGLDSYLALRRQQEEVDEEIATLDRDILEHERSSEKQCAQMKNYRDNELSGVHKAQREVLMAKQEKEARNLKVAYHQFKAEQKQKRDDLLEKQQLKMQTKKALQDEIERKKRGIDMDQLLDFVHTQQSAGSKRKRADSHDGV